MIVMPLSFTQTITDKKDWSKKVLSLLVKLFCTTFFILFVPSQETEFLEKLALCGLIGANVAGDG